MGNRQDGRHAVITSLYWVVLIGIGVAGLTHWLTGSPSNYATKPLFWMYMAVCAVGLLNALGLFRRR
jgi:hypothetical protein